MAGIANTLNQTFDGQIASLTQLQQMNRARGRSIPVMPYCFSTAAALSAQGQLDILDHAKIAHMSPEPGHLRLVVALRKVPIIDLKMRLGEASGAAVATLLVRDACAQDNGMATFDEAGANCNETP